MGGQWTDFIQDEMGPYQEEEPAYAAEAAAAASEGMSQSPFEELALDYDYEAHYEPIPLFSEEKEPMQQAQHHQDQQQQEADNEWIDIIETEHGLDTATRTIPDELEEPAWGFEEDQQRLEHLTIVVNKNLQDHADEPWERLTAVNPDFQAAKKKKKHKPSDVEELEVTDSSNAAAPMPYILVADAAALPTNPPLPPPAPPSLPVNTQPAAAPSQQPQPPPQQQQPVKAQPPPPAVQQQPTPQPSPPVQPPPAAPEPTQTSPPSDAAPGDGLPGMHAHKPGDKPSLTDSDDMTGTSTSTAPKPFFETTMLPYGYGIEAPVAFPSAGMPGNFGGIAQDLGRLGQIGVYSNSGTNHHAAQQMNSVAFFLIFVFACIHARI